MLWKQSRKRSDRQHIKSLQNDAGAPDGWSSTPKERKKEPRQCRHLRRPKTLERAWNYNATAARLVSGLGNALINGVTWVDAHIVDGVVNGTAIIEQAVTGQVRKSQNGFVLAYTAIIAVGVVVLLV